VSVQLALYRAGERVASSLPGPVAYRLGSGVGQLLGRVPDFDGKRSVAAGHMAKVAGRAFGRRERRRVVAEVFANYGRYWAESLRLPSLGAEEVATGVTVVGGHHFERARGQGRGVIIAAPHLGGWEWGATFLTRQGVPVTVAVEALEPPDLFEWFTCFRRRLGMEVVAVGSGASRLLLQALREGHAVCLLSDRLVGEASGVEVEFFGQAVRLPAGPVTLALRSRAPLMAAAIYFGRRPGSHRLVFREPVLLPAGGRFKDDVRRGTQLLARELEGLVRQAPTQWHMLQPHCPAPPLGRATPVGAAPRGGLAAGARS
jgi:lauroyl/myristoyl acyltransferase